MEFNIEMEFTADDDGYCPQQCDLCKKYFRVLFGQGSADPLTYCPYCKYKDDNFFTETQMEHAEDVATYYISSALEKGFNKGINRRPGQYGGLTFDFKSNPTRKFLPQFNSNEGLTNDSAYQIYEFKCCNEKVKLLRARKYYCIICGR